MLVSTGTAPTLAPVEALTMFLCFSSRPYEIQRDDQLCLSACRRGQLLESLLQPHHMSSDDRPSPRTWVADQCLPTATDQSRKLLKPTQPSCAPGSTIPLRVSTGRTQNCWSVSKNSVDCFTHGSTSNGVCKAHPDICLI